MREATPRYAGGTLPTLDANGIGKPVTPRTLQVRGEWEAAIGHFEQCQLANAAALPRSADSGGRRSSVEVS
ncbi:hypothetical protein [Streptomyces sp. NBC_00996]|uniref:hypothetical protein n=1 Tax=Streptomyces sp. NBC_00996 TaxID=2903710 RepID=UPI003863DB5C|nr:hypothetical protein OG390_48975 [Streptomyces sp. NBC_00996]